MQSFWVKLFSGRCSRLWAGRKNWANMWMESIMMPTWPPRWPMLNHSRMFPEYLWSDTAANQTDTAAQENPCTSIQYLCFDGERRKRERDTKRKSEGHLERRTTTFIRIVSTLVKLIRITRFCTSRQRQRNEVLTQILIGMPSMSIPKCDPNSA